MNKQSHTPKKEITKTKERPVVVLNETQFNDKRIRKSFESGGCNVVLDKPASDQLSPNDWGLIYKGEGRWHYPVDSFDEDDKLTGKVEAWLVPDKLNNLLDQAKAEGVKEGREEGIKSSKSLNDVIWSLARKLGYVVVPKGKTLKDIEKDIVKRLESQ